MTRALTSIALIGFLLCGCGVYGHLPKKAKPNQTVWGERTKNDVGLDRIYDEKKLISWRVPKGHHWEKQGSCMNKMRDGYVARVCSWKAVPGEDPEKDKESD